MAQGTVGGKGQGLVGIPDVQNVGLGITNPVLDLKVHGHQVLVLGQHLAGGLGSTYVRYPHLVHVINQRHLEAQARILGTAVFTETQHNGALLFVYGVERLVNHVTDNQDRCDRQDGTKATTATARAAAVVAGARAAFAAQHPVEFVEALFQRFVEVWRTLIIAATTTGPPGVVVVAVSTRFRSEEHTSELQSRPHLVCRLLLEKKKKN